MSKNTRFFFSIFSPILFFSLSYMPFIYSKEAKPANTVQLYAASPNHLTGRLMEQLKRIFGVNVFVETGTLVGTTAKEGAGRFNQVHTIELSENLYRKAKKNLRKSKNVTCYCGDSAKVLPEIISQIQGRPLFWLDAHYSGGETATIWNEDQKIPLCPLYDEIKLIIESSLNDFVILIDDIRGNPDTPESDSNLPKAAPSTSDILELLADVNPDLKALVIGDMLLIYNSKNHSPYISDLVHGCTASRLFNIYNHTDDEIRAVFLGEKKLINHPDTPERKMVENLCKIFKNNDIFHYRLWSGLIAFGSKEYTQAIDDFQYVLSRGYLHWRIFVYLAACYQAQGNLAQSEYYLEKIEPYARDFFDEINQFVSLPPIEVVEEEIIEKPPEEMTEGNAI